MIESDTRFFLAAQLDFKVMVRRRLKTLEPGRLNASRVEGLRVDNPEWQLLMELATLGMHVPRPEGFKPNGKEAPAPLRASYMKVHEAVNKMLSDTIQRGLAFILPKDMAIKMVPDLHLGTAYWAPKKGKASGSPIGDLSHVAGMPLNSPFTKDAAEAHYGWIVHPTITDVVLMINEFYREQTSIDPSVQWKDIRLWKT